MTGRDALVKSLRAQGLSDSTLASVESSARSIDAALGVGVVAFKVAGVSPLATTDGERGSMATRVSKADVRPLSDTARRPNTAPQRHLGSERNWSGVQEPTLRWLVGNGTPAQQAAAQTELDRRAALVAKAKQPLVPVWRGRKGGRPDGTLTQGQVAVAKADAERLLAKSSADSRSWADLREMENFGSASAKESARAELARRRDPVAKAANQVAVYNEAGQLLGIIDPAKITPVGSVGADDGGVAGWHDKHQAANEALTPVPSASVGTPADEVAKARVADGATPAGVGLAMIRALANRQAAERREQARRRRA